MGEQANRVFPFAIAVVLPPAGIIIGLAAMQQDRDLGLRLLLTAALAAVIWVLLLLSAT
jgi:hypothetical protein